MNRPEMTVSTSTMRRRVVSYRGYEMIVEDAERLAAGSCATLGNWTFPQILDHLARSFEASIDGIGIKLPWPVRLFGRTFLLGRFLNKTLPSGFQFVDGRDSRFAPDESVSVEAGLDALRRAVRRCMTEKQRSFHPLFGHLDRPSWDRFNLRHAELHMSFVVPVDDDSDASENPISKAASTPA